MNLSGLVGGVLNPLTMPAHLIALVGLGLFIGGGCKGKIIVPLAAFALGLAVGLAAIAIAIDETPALDVLLMASAATGLLIALAVVLPVTLRSLLAVIVGMAIGLNSPPQAISVADATLALIGTGFAACLALVLVAGCTTLITRDWQRIGLRIVGSWIAASSILVLALRFARGMLFGM